MKRRRVKSVAGENTESKSTEAQSFFDTVLGKVTKYGAALIMIASIVLYVINHGDTETSVSGIEQNGEFIAVNVTVKGSSSQRATLRGYCLRFGDLPIEDAQPKPAGTEDSNKQSIVGGGGFRIQELVGLEKPAPPAVVTINLSVSVLRGRCRDVPNSALYDRYTKEEIKKKIGAQLVTLLVRVESNGVMNKIEKQFPASDIKNFILNALPDQIPQKTCPDKIPEKTCS